MKYFVSYTTIDKEVTIPLLERLSNYLGASGTVYIDILHNDSTNKQERVLRELDRSDIVVLIESQNVYKSKWVQLEISRAVSCKKPIAKLCIESFEFISFMN